MALSLEVQQSSLEQLMKRCTNKLTEQKIKLLKAVNAFAAAHDEPLGFKVMK